MKCKNHPNIDAKQFCASCGIPICIDCIDEHPSGKSYCFQCAMLHSVSEVGSSLVDQRKKNRDKKSDKKKPWGPFQYFVIASSVLIAVMWVVIIFGGQKAPSTKIDFEKQERVFLFMVDSSIKRFAHYEQNKYPDSLNDLVPKYLPIQKEDIPQLGRLLYQKDTKIGYRLSIVKPKPGTMGIILTPNGIEYKPLINEGT